MLMEQPLALSHSAGSVGSLPSVAVVPTASTFQPAAARNSQTVRIERAAPLVGS